MKILLDEDVPQPLLDVVRHLLRGHVVEHVYTRGWQGKKDRPLFADAAAARFETIVTNNLKQFNDPGECSAIQKSGLHHVSYALDNGLDGLARASASILAAIRPVVAELEAASTQRIVRIHQIATKQKRYTLTDPATDPPSAYWP